MTDARDGTGRSAEAPAESARRIGDRYEVVRVLGEGSSARTLLCTDLRDARQVAVKELHFEHLDNWKYLELFEREAQALSRLDHRGIPKVYDFFAGQHTQGTLYFVQEFIDGASLRQRMESGPMLGQQEVYDCALGLLDVLDYLHGRAPPVLHRDIKPSNVLVRPDGDSVLVDFGGVSVGWRPPNATGTTVVGTFGYMPPEQLLGQGGPTADLYALGATLLHLATGTPPSDFPFDTGRIEVPTDLPAPPELTRLIEALLRPAPRDRPQTAAAARGILTGAATAVTRPDGVPAAVLPPSDAAQGIAIMSGDGPHFVDMGAPPRDPKGEFKDVYRNLVNPIFPAKLLWSTGIQVLAVTLYAVGTLLTVGILPAVYAAQVAKRRRNFTRVFQHGVFTRGTIVGVEKREVYATFRYKFEVAGSTYMSFMEYAEEMTRYWGQGDTVPVLYDPNDPRQCCFVYR